MLVPSLSLSLSLLLPEPAWVPPLSFSGTNGKGKMKVPVLLLTRLWDRSEAEMGGVRLGGMRGVAGGVARKRVGDEGTTGVGGC